jgi:A/G-specific adenine glycosylase
VKEAAQASLTFSPFHFFTVSQIVGDMNSKFQKRLLAWYRTHRRAMPWRGVRDPYRVWVSEVMLQQTRVAAVVDYYRRFVRRFPTLRSLARARESEVLKHWAGLGYYSRARNLHRAAKEILARHNGRFPREMEAALALPGVGRYTAAAVLSIAYGQPHAVLDGNVARVLARLDAIRGDVRQPRRWRQLQQHADAVLGASASGKGAQAMSLGYSPGEWNQAMMELGATVCTPRAPRCAECPVARWCQARQQGLTEQIPAPRRKPATQQVRVAAAVLLDPRGRTLLVPPNGAAHDGLFSRLWQFPAVEGAQNAHGNPLTELQKKAASSRRTAKRGHAARFLTLAPVRHTVTHREVTIVPNLLRVAELPQVRGGRTPRLEQLDALAVSSATRKIARRVLQYIALEARNAEADG